MPRVNSYRLDPGQQINIWVTRHLYYSERPCPGSNKLEDKQLKYLSSASQISSVAIPYGTILSSKWVIGTHAGIDTTAVNRCRVRRLMVLSLDTFQRYLKPRTWSRDTDWSKSR